MGTHSYPVEVQKDFLEKVTRARPLQALAELIWNSLDADATRVEVAIRENDLGGMSDISISDNGTGIQYGDAPELFRKLGGSWKQPGGKTERDKRFLHGQDGRGRFKAFALGGMAEWNVTYLDADTLKSFQIKMTASELKKVDITDESTDEAGDESGVILTISNLHKDYPSLVSESGTQELTETFALYLSDYKDVTISCDGKRIDPSSAIASRCSFDLSDIDIDGTKHPTKLDLIEWKSATNRALYLCNYEGFPLKRVEDRRFHIGPYQFSAYIKSTYISTLQREGLIELAELKTQINAAIDEAQAEIRTYFRKRAAQQARTIVEEWKKDQVYPYEGEAGTRVEEVERQVFDIVSVNVAQYLPDFSTTPKKNKAFQLRMLKQSIEKSPEELQLILDEVLKLPKRKQSELAELLRDTSLSAIISASKMVADRLQFLTGLEAILFDSDKKKHLKERSQLHRIIAQNCWLFGEEYSLSVDDRSLSEVLRKHRKLIGEDAVIDEPVKHISKSRGIVDLVLSRSIRQHKANGIVHLVVELKAPKVPINKKEIQQVEEYAISVMKDERFRNVDTQWIFWAISDDFGEYAEYRMKAYSESSGKIHEQEDHSIWVKTWAQVLEENRARLQFFKEKLEYEADKGASLEYLKERYSKFLEGVLVEEQETEKIHHKKNDSINTVAHPE